MKRYWQEGERVRLRRTEVQGKRRRKERKDEDRGRLPGRNKSETNVKGNGREKEAYTEDGIEGQGKKSMMTRK